MKIIDFHGLPVIVAEIIDRQTSNRVLYQLNCKECLAVGFLEEAVQVGKRYQCPNCGAVMYINLLAMCNDPNCDITHTYSTTIDSGWRISK